MINKFKKGFSLVEVLWGVFLLSTAILVIVGVIIAALEGMKKSEGIMDATNILIGEKSKILAKGYNNVATPPAPYVIDDYYVIYQVDPYDFGDATTVSNELQIVSLGVYNVNPVFINSASMDRLVRVTTTITLLYSP